MFRSKMNLLLSLAIAGIFSISAAAQCVAPPEGMTNWWTGDGNAFDIVGGYNGTLNGDAAFGDGMVAEAFSLDGAGDYVSVDDTAVGDDEAAPFNFDGSFTIDAWVNLDTLPTEFAPVVSKWNDLGVNERSYFLAVQNVGGQAILRFDVSSNGLFAGANSASVFSSTAMTLDTWYHVAGVYDADTRTLSLYLNGQLVGTDTLEGTDNAFDNDEPLLIGAGDLGGNVRDFFDGSIDEVELFDRALTQAEIQSIFNAGEDGKTISLNVVIKPDDDGDNDGPAPINLGSRGKTPVAVLGSETLDVTTIDVSSLTFAGASVAVKKNGTLQYSYEDVNDDGFTDLVLHFNTQDLDLTADSTEATLSGLSTTDRCLSGTDAIVIVP